MIHTESKKQEFFYTYTTNISGLSAAVGWIILLT